jgi:hypothetical protein
MVIIGYLYSVLVKIVNHYISSPQQDFLGKCLGIFGALASWPTVDMIDVGEPQTKSAYHFFAWFPIH